MVHELVVPGIKAVMLPGETPGQRDAFVSQVLALSDERDQWLARIEAAARAAYLQGFADGQAAAARADDLAWAAAPLFHVKQGLTQAELAQLRASHGALCRCTEHRSAVA